MELIKTYQKQGGKTLAVFILKRIPAFIAIIVLLSIISYGINFIPSVYKEAAAALLPWLYLFSALFLCAAIILGWLEYAHYRIFIYDDYLKVTRGIITENEIGIPYKLIKEVEIERSISDEILGFSSVLVTILGEEASAVFSKESTVSLPFLDKEVATEIQNAILERTDIEKNESTEPLKK